jgi:adenylate cyclase
MTRRLSRDEALRESEIARRLDPLSLIIATDEAVILYYARQYDRSIEKFRAVMDLDPEFPRAHMITGPYVQKGMFSEALANLDDWEREHQERQDGLWAFSTRAFIYGREGETDNAEEMLKKLQQKFRSKRVDVAPLVMASIGAGHNRAALDYLEIAYAQHSNMMTTLKVDPAFDMLRDEPRYQELLRRVGLDR